MPNPAPTPLPIDARLIAPFAEAIRDVFATMANLPVTLGEARVKESPAASYDVSGVVGFSGGVVGSVVVSFRRDAATAAVAGLAGAEMEYGGTDFADAVGELANMVAGAAKRGMGRPADITVPNVIIGPGHTVARLSGVPCVVIPCSTAAGDFAVEVNLAHA